MNKEINYGTGGLNGWNDGNAFGEPHPSTFGLEVYGDGEEQVTELKEDEAPLDINNSNTRLDKYLLYFSSRL